MDLRIILDVILRTIHIVIDSFKLVFNKQQDNHHKDWNNQNIEQHHGLGQIPELSNYALCAKSARSHLILQDFLANRIVLSIFNVFLHVCNKSEKSRGLSWYLLCFVFF